MQKIYIVLSYSGTLASRLIKLYTHKEYSHVSIALDEKLEHMYSFARLHAYNPFIAGFVKESTKYGTFKRFNKTKSKIYSLELSDEQYNMIKENIKKISSGDYHYNFLGLLGVAVNLHLKREKHFYCAEFVKYVLENSNVEIDFPEIVTIDDFDDIRGSNLVYVGRLNEYN